MPSSSQRATSSGRSPEVSIMIIVLPSSGSPRIFSARVKPLMPGMCGVGQDEAIGRPRTAGLAEGLQRFFAAGHAGRLHGPALQDLFEDLPVLGVVVDHQDPRPLRSSPAARGSLRRPLRLPGRA